MSTDTPHFMDYPERQQAVQVVYDYRGTIEKLGRIPNITNFLNRLNSLHSPEAQYYAGEICVDAALSEATSLDPDDLLNKAAEIWSSNNTTRGASVAKAKMGMALAILPEQRHVFYHNSLPSAETETTVLRGIIDSAIQAMQFQEYATKHGRRAEAISAVGVTAEGVFFGLHKRFTLCNHLTDTMLATGSTIREDVGRRVSSQNQVRRSWDATIYGQHGETRNIDYRLQIKSSRSIHTDFVYDHDISMLFVRDELVVTHREHKERAVSPRKIISELDQELQGNADISVSERLDARTQLMLDAIDIDRTVEHKSQ